MNIRQTVFAAFALLLGSTTAATAGIARHIYNKSGNTTWNYSIVYQDNLKVYNGQAGKLIPGQTARFVIHGGGRARKLCVWYYVRRMAHDRKEEWCYSIHRKSGGFMTDSFDSGELDLRLDHEFYSALKYRRLRFAPVQVNQPAGGDVKLENPSYY